MNPKYAEMKEANLIIIVIITIIIITIITVTTINITKHKLTVYKDKKNSKIQYLI